METKKVSITNIKNFNFEIKIHRGIASAEREEYRFEQDAYGFDIQPDDINYIMNIFSIKTKGYFIDSEGKKNNFPENIIDKYVIPTLPKDE